MLRGVVAAATLDFLDLPILVVDEDLTVRGGNQSGFLAANSGSVPLRIHGGRAVPRSAGDAAVLVTVIGSKWPRVVTFSEPRRHALVIPAVADALTMLRCAFIVFCDTPPEVLQPEVLRHVFGLTSAEADVAVMVGLGSIAECARLRGTTVGTVRSQVKCVLAKLQLKSVAQLARLILVTARTPCPSESFVRRGFRVANRDV